MSFLRTSDSFKAFVVSNYSINNVFNLVYRAVEYGFNSGFYFGDTLVENLFTEEINYLTFRSDGMLSYLPKGKEHKTNEDGTWKRDGRQDGKAAKVIRKLFTKEALTYFKDADFDAFGKQFKSHFAGNYTMELWDNERIPEVYNMERARGGGALNNSCMNDESTSYFEIYANCEKLKILVCLNEEGFLAGRALVWNATAMDDFSHLGEITFMDRVYVTSEFLEERFFSYALENKWYRKTYQNYSDKRRLTFPDSTTNNVSLKVETDTEFGAYPYIDTFTYGSYGVLFNNSAYGSGYEYDNTDGERGGDPDEDDYQEDDDSVYCAHSGDYHDISDMTCIDYGQYAGSYIHDDYVAVVNGFAYFYEDSRIVTLANGRYAHVDEVTYCSYNEEYYLSSECVYSEKDECDYLESDCVECDLGWILERDSVEIDGVYYHEDHVPTVETEEEIA